MEAIKGFLKGAAVSIAIILVLSVLSFFGLMASAFPGFNIFYFALATLGIWQFLYLWPWYKKRQKKNRKHEAYGVLISSIFGVIILTSNIDYLFTAFRTDLEELPNRELNFTELPVEVQKRYIVSVQKSTYGEFISIDSDLETKTYNTTMDDGFFTLLKEGFKHHFIINKKHFVLQANQGDPFIVFNRKFYYSKDLNLYPQTVEDAKFVEIDLEDEL